MFGSSVCLEIVSRDFFEHELSKQKSYRRTSSTLTTRRLMAVCRSLLYRRSLNGRSIGINDLLSGGHVVCHAPLNWTRILCRSARRLNGITTRRLSISSRRLNGISTLSLSGIYGSSHGFAHNRILMLVVDAPLRIRGCDYLLCLLAIDVREGGVEHGTIVAARRR
jgi:hypothetical protein